MKATVLVKCPHDVRAEVQESVATPDFKEEASFHIASVNVSFDCDICKGYHSGWKEAKADSEPQVRLPRDPIGGVTTNTEES